MRGEGLARLVAAGMLAGLGIAHAAGTIPGVTSVPNGGTGNSTGEVGGLTVGGTPLSSTIPLARSAVQTDITGQIDAAAVPHVATIATLRAKPCYTFLSCASYTLAGTITAPSDGAVLNVLGYYTVGDLGGGLFRWNAASTATDDGGITIAQTGTTTGRWVRIPPAGGYLVPQMFGAKGDGTTDDTAAVNATAAALGNQGGGLMWGGASKYLANSGNLLIPSGVKVACQVPLVGNNNPTNYLNTKSAFIIAPAYSLVMGQASELEECSVLSTAAVASNPTTAQQAVALAASFTGTGIKAASDVTIRNTFIGGFALGIQSASGARARFENINIDATACIASSNSHDISRFRGIHCFPFLTSGAAGAPVSTAISGIADNGAGLWRVTTSAPHGLIVGNTVYVTGAVGAYSANGRFAVSAVPSSTTLDLAASSSSGVSATGSITQLSNLITGMTLPAAGIGPGTTITGTGIPAGTTVKTLVPSLGIVVMSTVASATNASVGLTFSDSAYSSGGTVIIDPSQRTGVGIEWTLGETSICIDCYVYGHYTGFHMGTGAAWTGLMSSKADQNNALSDYNSIGLLIDGTANGTQAQGFNTQSVGTSVVVNSTGSGAMPHVISNGGLANNGGPVVAAWQGRLILEGNGSPVGSAKYLVVGNNMTLTMGNNDMGVQTSFQGTNSRIQFLTSINTYSGNQFQGYFTQPGSVALGGTSACPNWTCAVIISGPLRDATGGNTTMVSGGTYNQSGTSTSQTLTAGGTIASYTMNLSVPQAGQIFNGFFTQAVTALTWTATSGAVLGGPTSIAANKWVRCQTSPDGTTWQCS